MDNVWSIAGHEIKTGEKKQVYVQVMDSEEYMPVTFINGTRDGKTVLVTSGIHGGEYEGIHAACEIARDLKSEDICGQLAIIHPVSVQTFESKQENITPIDGKMELLQTRLHGHCGISSSLIVISIWIYTDVIQTGLHHMYITQELLLMKLWK